MEIISKQFEELSASELYDFLKARAEVFAVEQNIAYQDLDGLDQCSTHLFASDENGRLASYLRVIPPGVKHSAASIGRVLTVKDFRGRGLARRMMGEAIAIALSMSDTIEIEAQAYLKNFYESLGFIATSEEFILEGLPHISMKLERAESGK